MKIDRILSSFGLGLAILGLWVGYESYKLTIYQTEILSQRISMLETKKRENLFEISSPSNNSTLATQSLVELSGDYVDAIPENAIPFAVVRVESDYYLQLNPVNLEPNRKWSLRIRPTGAAEDFKVIICLIDKDKYGIIDVWLNDLDEKGNIKPRKKLDSNITKNSIFAFVVK